MTRAPRACRGLNLSDEEFKQVERIVITACGTSWHSALIGEYMLEEMARIPVEVEYASEFRYRNPVVDPRTLVIGISQSGETADTLAAIREAKRRGARTVGLVNVVGSTIAREVDGGIYLHAGPEVGVASTKAFTSQVAALALVTLRLARLRNLSILQGRQFIEALRRLPEQIADILERSADIEELADRFLKSTSNALYLGRGVNFPVALEGALKLKEISYIHAEGYPAAEMKHGPIALIDENMPVVFIAPRDAVHSKIVSNIEEVKARGGKVIALDQRGRHRDRAPGGRHVHDPRDARHAHADPDEHSAAAAVVLRRRRARLQRGPAAQPGQVGHGRVVRRIGAPNTQRAGQPPSPGPQCLPCLAVSPPQAIPVRATVPSHAARSSGRMSGVTRRPSASASLAASITAITAAPCSGVHRVGRSPPQRLGQRLVVRPVVARQRAYCARFAGDAVVQHCIVGIDTPARRARRETRAKLLLLNIRLALHESRAVAVDREPSAAAGHQRCGGEGDHDLAEAEHDLHVVIGGGARALFRQRGLYRLRNAEEHQRLIDQMRPEVVQQP